LGPFEVRLNGHVVPLGGAKQRLVLAALLMHSNAVVSLDRLADVVWEDAPPEDAAGTLAKYVYRLRSALGPAHASILATRPPGYQLCVEPGQLDSARFTALLGDAQQLLSGEPEQAKALLDNALGLWRGPAWDEFADMDFVRAEVTRLDGLRAMALEDRADTMLALGRHEELIPELEGIVSEHPLRERPHAQLMFALYFSGRHADALAVYREFRRYLLKEVGLEPSADLRRLEQDVLRQNVRLAQRTRPALAAIPPAPTADLGMRARFIGRRNDLDWLEVLFGRASTAEHPVVGVIGGETGIGKTSLVKAFGRRLQARGVVVRFGRCDEVLDVTGSLLEVLRVRPETTFGPSVSADKSFPLVDEALAGLGETPLLLALDDLDAAAADAKSLLEHLASIRLSARVCVIATTPNIDEEWLHRTDGALHVRVLAGLNRAEAADLLTTVSGASRPPALVDSVFADTTGNPSLITAIGRTLRDADIARRVDRALARGETARRGLTEIRDEVALGVLARRDLSSDRDRDPSDRHSTMCPYKGLASFGVADAPYFCGRDRLVAQLVARLAVDRFLGVIGPSGSGKSSLVAAGLLPALASDALPGSKRWPSLVIRPGADPIQRLATGLAPFANESASAVRARLDSDASAIVDIARYAAPSEMGRRDRLVVVVDQFEEVFTSCSDGQARTRFLRMLVESSADPDSPLVVALVMRADYYGACAEEPELAKMLADSHVLVSAMTDRELGQAVLEPARRAGLAVEDGLPDAICADAAGEPGALPLVSTALLETWVRRSGDTLTLAGYAQAGGVRGAVAHLAEGVYDSLDSKGKEILRHIFLRLTDLQGATSDVRRRASRDEVASDGAERAVLELLIRHRLVTATEDTVEVAHEALLREWPRLRVWLEEDREGRRLHRQLADAAVAWQHDNRDDAGLYRGVRLQAARDWAASHPRDANPIETEFLAESEAAHERTLRTARRSARRLRSLAIGLAALLILAVIAGVLLVAQRSETNTQANLARSRALEAETSRLAALARTLADNDRDVAMLLGAQSYRIKQSDETAGGLQAAVVQTAPGLDRIIRYRSPAVRTAADRSGHRLAVASQDGTVTIYEIATGRAVRTLKWPRPRENATFSGDGRLVAAGGFDGQVVIWDLTTGRQSGRPLTVGGNAAWAVFDPTDAARMYAVTDTGQLTTWDRHDPGHPRQTRDPIPFAGGAYNQDPSFVTISPNGRLIAAGDPVGGTFDVRNARSGNLVRTLTPSEGHQGGGLAGEFAADNATLPAANTEGVELYNVITGHQVLIPVPGGARPQAALSSDGHRLAVTDQNQNVAVYDARSRQAIGVPLRLRDNDASPLAFLPDGRLLTSGTTSAEIWSVDRTLPPVGVVLPASPQEDNPTATTILPGDEVVTIGEHGDLVRHDPVTGEPLGPLLDGAIQSPVTASPDGRYLAAPSAHTGVVAIWDRTNGQQLGPLSGLPAEAPGVFADATLAWSPIGNSLAVDFGPALQLWDVTNPHRPRLQASVPSVGGVALPNYLLFSHDGHAIVTATSDSKRVTAIDVRSHRVKWSFIVPDFALRQVALSPDNKTLAVDSGDPTEGRVTLYDTATGVREGSVTTKSYGGVEFLHRGDWMVVTTGLTEPNAQIYDAKTLQPIGVPYPTTASGGSFGDPIAVNNSGTMFSESEWLAPLLWTADPTRWLTIACHIAGRNLTRAEWRQYLPSRPYQITCPEWPGDQ
jgi:DNA-binding SARP family transcriptional activator/WD40 repeat protein